MQKILRQAARPPARAASTAAFEEIELAIELVEGVVVFHVNTVIRGLALTWPCLFGIVP